jgi:RimJ/RimL family protein N-acetyltransferase
MSTRRQDFAEPIETGRVRLRAVQPEDASAIARLMTSTVSRWLASWPYPLTEEAARELIVRWRTAVAERRAFQRVVERQSDAMPMGWISVSREEADPRRGGMGYWLNEAFQGQGYMAEAATVAVEAAFNILDLDVIEAGAQCENAASFAIMRRLGMTPAQEKMVWASTRNRDEVCLFYEVTRDAFSRRGAM